MTQPKHNFPRKIDLKDIRPGQEVMIMTTESGYISMVATSRLEVDNSEIEGFSIMGRVGNRCVDLIPSATRIHRIVEVGESFYIDGYDFGVVIGFHIS